MKVLVLEHADKTHDLKTEEARKEDSIEGQSALVADQELGKTELNQNDSSKIDIIVNLLNEENSLTILTPPSHISTTGVIHTHGNRTCCSEINVKVSEKDVQEKDMDSKCSSCTCKITEGSEEFAQ